MWASPLSASPESERHFNIGLRHARSGDYQNAEREYRLAIATDSTDVRAHDGLGFVYALQNRLPEAEEAFARTLRIDPGYVPSLYKLGKIHLIRQDLGKRRRKPT